MMAGTGRTGQLRDGHAQFTLHPPARRHESHSQQRLTANPAGGALDIANMRGTTTRLH
jgi:hypothetical protein